MLRGFLYRVIMRIAHRYHWHYAPPIYPDGDTMLWCKWCGMRDVISRASRDTSMKAIYTQDRK
jgi:hypothetical protein